MSLTYGSALLQKTAVQSFWNGYYGLSDPFEGLYVTRPSTQKTDTYTSLGAAPMPEVWSGDRNAKTAIEREYALTNKPYEATVKVDKELIKYQQWDEVGALVSNLGAKARALIPYLLTILNDGGDTTVCEDGQYFYDDDHVTVGAEYQTNQDNDLTSAAATGTVPVDTEMIVQLRLMFNAFYGFKDEYGHPTVPSEENKADFPLLVPPSHLSVSKQMENNELYTGPLSNDMMGRFTTRVNPWDTQGDQQCLFWKGGPRKPFIVQESQGVQLSDQLDFQSGHMYYTVTWWGTVGYGEWRTAVSQIYS